MAHRIVNRGYFVEVDQDETRRNNPFEIRMRKIHHTIAFMLRRAPRNVRSHREFFFMEMSSPAGRVIRMEHIEWELAQEIARREKMRSIRRCKAIKEELMSVCWHPDRVERILELGGHELLDALD